MNEAAMTFADGDSAGWIVGVAGLLTAAGTVAVSLIRTWHRNRVERERTAIEQYRELADRHQKQLERQERHILDMTTALSDLHDDHADCQVEVAELFGQLQLLHDFGRRMAACLQAVNQDPGEVPSMPERPRRSSRADADYRRRTLQQNTQLLASSANSIPRQPDLPAAAGGAP